ncbi:hypothetical protein DQ04_02361080 [Trypanosoma grayi]|uniref:hypothetical protein n=1 Tax=Trypanosoma grayi TaxID=71804 RepID=UPI0004F49001|nr:hypothetical protein DQ04_02361080 [Trypanosoma grayi]KEG11696.1 hypothetical protein DQ04_02361080 [Trypanosoma grayi]
MQRRLPLCGPLLPASAFLRVQRRCYYDRICKDREGSDDSPADMFDEFPKNPAANSVPEELHTASTEAVGAAENLQRWFLVGSTVLFLSLHFSGFLDPFNDGYQRPEGYGTHGGGGWK